MASRSLKSIGARIPATLEQLLVAAQRELWPAFRELRQRFNAIVPEYNFVDASSGPQTVTLPAASESSARISVKKTDSSGNAVTVVPSGSDTIDGATSKSLPNQYDSVEVVSDGESAWYEL